MKKLNNREQNVKAHFREDRQNNKLNKKVIFGKMLFKHDSGKFNGWNFLLLVRY